MDEADDAGEASPTEESEPGSAERAAPFPVVAIGCSAGGLDALSALLKRLAYDSMAFIVVQHLATGHEEILKELLARVSPVPVQLAADGIALEKGRMFVAPGNAVVALEHGAFRIGSSGVSSRHTIDALFRSLAADQRSAAIGVVLSGSGTDGTLGLQAIKHEGGITFVQDPTTAQHSAMPQSALDSGFADFCLAPDEIGDELMRLGAHPYVAKAARPQILDQESLARVFAPLRDVFGVDFGGYKRASIERRIQRRMALLRIDGLDAYAKHLGQSSTELNALYHDLLIGVTSFFRDKEPFEALKAVVFPRLLENRDLETPIRIWVPGCSTGEEPYSIAMCLIEYCGEKGLRHRVQIFGTDIDEQALERARIGIYPQNIDLDVTPGRLQRFFARADKGYQISRQVREMVVFARHNLAKDPPFSRLDLVSCRNVLIYLQSPLQKKIMRVFHYGLNPSGFLLLGTSESVAEGSDLFQLVDRRLRIYSKKNIASRAVFDVAFGGSSAEPGEDRARPRAEGRPTVSAQQLADRKVLEKYGPPGVVVNENLEILQFRGRTGPFLEPTPGSATLHLLKLARPELLVALRSTIKKALTEALPASSEIVRIRDAAGAFTNLRLDVLPLFDATASTRSLLVLFNATPPADVPGPPAERTEADSNPRIIELERELATTKEYLQTTIEELETTNEELTSANEELQSSNEELQSTNEELSTSKEELQSTNEELSTVNEELHHRLAELSIANDDFQNLMTTSSTVAVIVGADMRIRRFSEAAERLLHLIPADIGRPISYLSSTLKIHDLEATAAEVANSMAAKTLRARASDGREYDVKISAYKTSDQAIRGVVLELTSCGPPAGLRHPGEIHGWSEQLLKALPRPMLVLDEDLRILWANEPLLKAFGRDKQIFGSVLDAVWGGAMDEPLQRFLQDVVSRRLRSGQRVVPVPFSDRVQPMRWLVTALDLPQDKRAVIVVMEDAP